MIDGTPLIVAAFGDAVFLDTIRLERISMNIPPYPQWQWTGNWERMDDPNARATASLSAEFGPTVLFGVVNDDSIFTLQVVRDGIVIQSSPLEGTAFIIPANEVRLTDTVEFLDADGDLVISVALMNQK